MLFPTATFAAFFTVVFAGHSMLRAHRTGWMTFMLAASVAFYGWTDPRFVLILVAGAAIGHTAVIHLVDRPGTAQARWILAAAVTTLIGALVAFKYTPFLADVANDLAELVGTSARWSPPDIVLPLGISFITFQVIGYCVDAYRGTFRTRPVLLESALFVAFFPHLAAGPLLRAKPFLAQLRSWPRNTGSIGLASFLILGGLVKKVIVADALFDANAAVHADPDAFSALDNAVNLYGGMVRIFCDVSSYTDIALGLGILLGIQLPENFNRPFAAHSLSDFWRRWHISVSSWFRDYLFRPLSGASPRGRRLIVAALITMILSGLWHGAGWGFALWGLLHGLVLVAEGAWRVRGVNRRRAAARAARSAGRPVTATTDRPRWQQRALHAAGVIFTFNFVVLTGSLFVGNTPAESWHKVELLVGDWTSTKLLTPLVVAALVAPVLAQALPWRLSSWAVPRFDRCPPVAQAVALAVAVTAIYSFAAPGIAPYLYFGV